MRRPLVPLFLLVAALCVGCASAAGEPRSNPLVGTWEGVSGNAVGTQVVFASGGRATWRLGETFDVQYRFDAAAEPQRLDLFGFDRGPLAGRTLHCIYDLAVAGELRLDCEPGRADSPPDAVRLQAFDPVQTQVFRRAR